MDERDGFQFIFITSRKLETSLQEITSSPVTAHWARSSADTCLAFHQIFYFKQHISLHAMQDTDNNTWGSLCDSKAGLFRGEESPCSVSEALSTSTLLLFVNLTPKHDLDTAVALEAVVLSTNSTSSSSKRQSPQPPIFSSEILSKIWVNSCIS